MALAGVAFIGYGIVFLVLNFVGSGFELGVSTLDGMTKAGLNPTLAYYISHLHVATAGFIISTGIAVTALSWYGVRQRIRWAIKWVCHLATDMLSDVDQFDSFLEYLVTVGFADKKGAFR
ncbi:hypothetical protein ACFQO4_00675 [Saliphagus sp. GCM10025334]